MSKTPKLEEELETPATCVLERPRNKHIRGDRRGSEGGSLNRANVALPRFPETRRQEGQLL